MPAGPEAHRHILDEIARDLAGDANFPTCLDAALLIRNTLSDPFADLDHVARAVGIEPLISSRLLHLANSTAFNPSGARISSLATVIGRLGFNVVRTISLAVAMDQMLKSKQLTSHQRIAHEAWACAVQVAAIARVLARRLGRISPDEAMLAGLVHNIGIFYLLYRAGNHLEYQDNEPLLLELLAAWHTSTAARLLEHLGLPATITEAVRDQRQPHPITAPSSISDILHIAVTLANCPVRQAGRPTESELAVIHEVNMHYAELLKEADDDLVALRAALSP